MRHEISGPKQQERRLSARGLGYSITWQESLHLETPDVSYGRIVHFPARRGSCEATPRRAGRFEFDRNGPYLAMNCRVVIEISRRTRSFATLRSPRLTALADHQEFAEIPTNFASACQCLGCGRRRPAQDRNGVCMGSGVRPGKGAVVEDGSPEDLKPVIGLAPWTDMVN